MYKNNDITHTFAFMYAAFAHLTDGEVQAEEKKVIGEKVYSWLCTFDNDVTGDGKIDGDDVISILFDDVFPYYDSMNVQGRLEEFDRIVALHVSQDWWTDEMSNGVLRDLEDIALADGKLMDTEQEWLGILARAYGVTKTA
tara:strand:+ start:453 stop:875 length:423 start_codon:yes stop_codon:yes gene_type:complete